MTPKHNLPMHRTAFTLIEMMIVIGIIALLAALTLGISNSVLRNSEISRTKDALRLLDMALQEWELEMGRAMTFRDFSSLEGIGGGFGQGELVPYRYDVNAFFDLNGEELDDPLLGAPVFGVDPVDDATMLEAMSTRMRNVVLVLLESEPATDMLQRISPRHFKEMDLDGNNSLDGKVGVDAWDTPIGIVFPCQNYANANLDGNVLPQDESGDLTVRDQAEDGLGSCMSKRPYFVSAGPDRMWGYRYQASSSDNFPGPQDEDWLASLDNIYSYEPYLVEESR
jgi:prepilin-type N-terminal cleavage/methylation domain-containing protein